MNQAAPTTASPRDWRFSFSVGLAIGVGIAASRAVGAALGPDLGFGWALILRAVVAAGVGGVLAPLVGWLLGTGKKPSGPAER